MRFPFHHGSIETHYECWANLSEKEQDFHSTMVRLRLVRRPENGNRGGSETQVRTFPFHNGSIETRRNSFGLHDRRAVFHSTMVRLRRLGNTIKNGGEVNFPFHHGSIETRNRRKHRNLLHLFHSTMVRLRPSFHTVIFLYFLSSIYKL
jgi:hypothetical protein